MLNVNGKRLCDGCFSEIDGVSCLNCTAIPNVSKYPTSLKNGTILAGKYVIGRVLGKGGFGITYLCYDLKNNKKMAIKEYLPDTLALRNQGETQITVLSEEKRRTFSEGAKRFLEEARTVSAFNDNSNIIGVTEFFFENNTSYFVMEYLEGQDFKSRLFKKADEPLTTADVIRVIDKITDALNVVHGKGVLHRDVAPDNIFICKNGDVKLIDFGASHKLFGESSRSAEVILKHGFAPIEQYHKDGKQGPWTDIYALGATMYYALTGKIIPKATDRFESPFIDFAGIPTDIARLLQKMLQVNPADRYQDTFALKRDINAIKLAYGIIEAPDVKKKDNTTPILKLVIGVAAVIVAVLVAILLIPRQEARVEEPELKFEEKDNSTQASLSSNKVNKPSNKPVVLPSPDKLPSNSNGQEIDKKPLELPKGNNSSTIPPIITTDKLPSINDILTDKDAPLEDEISENEDNKADSNIIEEGVCGNTLTYTLDKSGVLTITGSGTMTSWSGNELNGSTEMPWYDNLELITEVVITEGVTEIGNFAFNNCTSLSSVTLPEGLTYIGANSFAGCVSLKTINIPLSVTAIGIGCFKKCTALESIVIPFNVTEVADVAFAECKSLESVEILEGLETIGNSAFNGCTALTYISLPDTVTVIEPHAFANCTSVKSITIPSSVKALGIEVFLNWGPDQTIYMHSGFTTDGIWYLNSKALVIS